MSSVVCFQHPKFSGETSPSLLCRACCKIYVDKLEQEKFNPTEWLLKKSIESQQKGK